jgi:hypothetical protein
LQKRNRKIAIAKRNCKNATATSKVQKQINNHKIAIVSSQLEICNREIATGESQSQNAIAIIKSQSQNAI